MTNFPYLTEQNDPYLFSPKLISQEVLAALPDGYVLRPLKRDDYNKGEWDKTKRIMVSQHEDDKQFHAFDRIH